MRIGNWAREADAGLACDRARIHFGLAPLNFPERALKLGAADPALLRRVGASTLGCGIGTDIFGLRFSKARQVWSALMYDGMTRDAESLGDYPTHEQAALAFDRCAKHLFGNAAVLNFPERAAKPMSPSDLRGSKDALPPTTSQFAGVDLDSDAGLWNATYWLPETTRLLRLGGWGSEKEAAKARDRAAARHGGAKCHLNFPKERSQLKPASDAELRTEAKRLEQLSETVGRTWREGPFVMIRFKGRTLRSAHWAAELGMSREALRVRMLKADGDLSRVLTLAPRPAPEPKRMKYKGRTRTVAEWAKDARLDPAVLRNRLSLGWTMDSAMKTPLRGR